LPERRSDALHIDSVALERALRATPEIALFFLGGLAGRVRILLDRVDRLATAHVSTRLCAYLLERAERTSDATIAITQESLAEELGTVREIVVRTLRVLRERGVIRTAGRGRIEVIDLAGLRIATTKELEP
jgi:CRP-like cAMP-binding protein